MRGQLLARRAAPLSFDRCDLAEVTVDLIPYVLGAFYLREQKYNWLAPEDAKIMRQQLNRQGAALLMGCKDEFLFEFGRIYRLLDYTLLGHAYTATGELDTNGLPVVAPALPSAPSGPPLAGSALALLQQARNFQASLAIGETNADAADVRNIRDQLDTIIAALQAEENLDPEILARLVQIAALLA